MPIFNGLLPLKGHLEFSGVFFLTEISEKASFDAYNFRITSVSARNVFRYRYSIFMFAAFLVIFVFAPLVLLCGSLVFHCSRSFVLRVSMDGRSDGHVITKISRVYSLPYFLTYGAPLHMLRARESSAKKD